MAEPVAAARSAIRGFLERHTDGTIAIRSWTPRIDFMPGSTPSADWFPAIAALLYVRLSQRSLLLMGESNPKHG